MYCIMYMALLILVYPLEFWFSAKTQFGNGASKGPDGLTEKLYAGRLGKSAVSKQGQGALENLLFLNNNRGPQKICYFYTRTGRLRKSVVSKQGRAPRKICCF